MSGTGRPVAVAIVVAVLAIGGLVGALIATGYDDSDETIVTLPETTTSPAPEQTAAGQATIAAPPADPDDAPLGRAEAKRVGAAAVAAVGGGTAVEIDRSDDPGEAYEVEVMTDRGEVDVALDDNLRRVENVPYDD
jgi:hypothetical protein